VATAAEVVALDPLFSDGGAVMGALCERFGEHRTYGEHERIEIAEGPGLRGGSAPRRGRPLGAA
jgi:hypothetical protein